MSSDAIRKFLDQQAKLSSNPIQEYLDQQAKLSSSPIQKYLEQQDSLSQKLNPILEMQERIERINAIPDYLENTMSLMKTVEKSMLFGAVVDPFKPLISNLDKYSLENFITKINMEPHIEVMEKLAEIQEKYSAAGYKFRDFDLLEDWTSEEARYYREKDEEYFEKVEGQDEEPQNKKSSIILIEEALRIKTIIEGIHKDNEEVFKLKPRDFEEMVAELYRSKNFKVELTKQTRDGGFDIMAIQDLGGHKNKYLIECKHWAENRPVGIQVVRSFMDVIQENNANKGIICTTSYFSREAKQREAQKAYLLDLRDRMDILEWVADYLQNYQLKRF